MTERKSGYINVDELMPQITVEQAAAFYGVETGELHRTSDEIRTRCFLNCGKSEETGDRALAICNDATKRWKCHQYGCPKGGNLVGLCDLMKPGPVGDGRPRGERFKAIARDLQAMVRGENPELEGTPKTETPSQDSAKPDIPANVNVLLKDSTNERARGLVDLDRKFIVDVADMNPSAASYFRQRPYLSANVCRKWRMGYLSRDTGGDKAGGTMRGKVVYPMLDEQGEVLSWFGRDPEFEENHRKWLAGGKQGTEPAKFQFVRGFHRGLELFGQHQFREEFDTAKVRETGLLVVEGPNDVIALDCLGERSVGLTSNNITDEQVAKIVHLANRFADGHITLMLDCDAEGDRGAKEAVAKLAEHCFVRLAWTTTMHGGRYRDQQPESLSFEEFKVIRDGLARVPGKS